MPINRPKEKVYHDRPNTLLSITEVKTYMIRFAGPDGLEEIAQVQVFGKNTDDGGIGVWVVANEEQLNSTLRVATPTLTRLVRSKLSLLSDPATDDLPENLVNVEVTGTEDETNATLDTSTL